MATLSEVSLTEPIAMVEVLLPSTDASALVGIFEVHLVVPNDEDISLANVDKVLKSMIKALKIQFNQEDQSKIAED